ncbi:MAG: purine-nucleoside phosphorylase [Syntrophobacteraceae bacterium]
MIGIRVKVAEATAHIKPYLDHEPAIGLILGTGLGGIIDEMDKTVVLPYADIPHSPVSTVTSHHGQLVLGNWAGKSIIALQGRFHLYEGYTPMQISFPIRVLRSLGVKTLVISNAAGGLNPNYKAGELMLISDHINFTGQNPLAGENIDEWGVRFTDMTEPYSRRLIEVAERTALEERIPLQKGVYVGVLGPNLETAAETRFLRMIGADAVGMSTVMEVITAAHAGMDVLAVSVITNVNLPDCYKPAPVEQIIATANSAGEKLGRLFAGILGRM